MMKKSVSEKEFIKFFEDNANKFNLNVLDDNQLNLDTIAESCGKNKNGIESGDVLKYIYNNLETKGKFNADHNFNKDENTKINLTVALSDKSYRTYCIESVQRIATATADLTDIFNSNQKTRKPWWRHFVFVFSALTCTGIYWIIVGCQNKDDENNKNGDLGIFDYIRESGKNNNKITHYNNITENTMTQLGKKPFGIGFGVFNMLSLALLVCSLVFSWTIFAQIIFGIMTFCCVCPPVLFSIVMAWKDFQCWQKERTEKKINTQAQRILEWLKGGMPKKEENLNLTISQNVISNDNSIHTQQVPKQEQIVTSKNQGKGQFGLRQGS